MLKIVSDARPDSFLGITTPPAAPPAGAAPPAASAS